MPAKKPTTRKPKPRPKSRGLSIAALKDFCRSLPGATEDVKWGHDLIFSVGKKMFAGFDTGRSAVFSFKCDQQDQFRLIQLNGIIPAPYAARFGWVSVREKDALSMTEARQLLNKAHRLVLAGLPKRTQAEILAKSSAR